MSEWYETKLTVRYAETDQMGVVHHASYLVWFELGRTNFCRQKGFAYSDMEKHDNALMVVAEAYCRYKSPAHYEDEITIKTKLDEVKSRTLRFMYEVYRESDDSLLAEGETLHVVTDHSKKVRSLPQKYKDMLMAETRTK